MQNVRLLNYLNISNKTCCFRLKYLAHQPALPWPEHYRKSDLKDGMFKQVYYAWHCFGARNIKILILLIFLIIFLHQIYHVFKRKGGYKICKCRKCIYLKIYITHTVRTRKLWNRENMLKGWSVLWCCYKANNLTVA